MEGDTKKYRYFFDYECNTVSSSPLETEMQRDRFYDILKIQKRIKFEHELRITKPEDVEKLIEFHLKYFQRQGGYKHQFVNELRNVKTSDLNKLQLDALLSYIEKHDNPPDDEIYSKDNPLNNYHAFIKHYLRFYNGCRIVVNPTIYRKLSIEMELVRIDDLYKWAMHELELQFLNNPAASKWLHKKVEKDCEDLIFRFRNLIRDNDLENVMIIKDYNEFFNIYWWLVDFWEEFKTTYGNNSSERKNKPEESSETPRTYQELFYNPNDASVCLEILKELDPPIIDFKGNYIGRKSKGVIPIWLRALSTYKGLIKPCSDMVYKDIMNLTIPNLQLSADASEFRKNYPSLKEKDREIKTILSRFSQEGRLGK